MLVTRLADLSLGPLIEHVKVLRRWLLRALDAVPGRLAREWKGAADANFADFIESRPESTWSPPPVVSAQLHDRLTDDEVRDARRIAASTVRDAWRNSSAADRLAIELHCLVHACGPGGSVAGLTSLEPPPTVHHSSRGVLASGGALRLADLVAHVITLAGVDLSSGLRVLDFGCSTGRVVRPLQAAYPGTEWHGCDPNVEAVGWAQSNLHNLHFHLSETEPPLPFPSERFDAVFGISVWSHFSPAAARRWLDEMARVLGPGGHLLITTHGFASAAHFAHQDKVAPSTVLDICRSLISHGAYFQLSFGRGGDWGVEGNDWGTAFYSPEWILSASAGRWRIVSFLAGGLERNQDVYVLQRA